MSIKNIKSCDRCEKSPINEEYTLRIGVEENTPASGGVITGFELNQGFDYCNSCKIKILGALLVILREKQQAKELLP